MEHVDPKIFNDPASSQKSSGRLSLLGMGLFELGFVVVLLCIVFGILNYFSILPVSKALPFLSFLPRLSKTANSTVRVPQTPQATNSAALKDPTGLLSYITSSIQPAYLPPNLSELPIVHNNDQVFVTWSLTQGTTTGLARFTWEKDMKTIQVKRLALQTSSTTKISSLTPQTAQDFASQLLLGTGDGKWTCTTTTACSLTTSSPNKKTSTKLFTDSSLKIFSLSTCEVDSTSSLFAKFTTCP